MMKRLGIAITVLALGVAGCGDDNNGNPGGPSNTTVFTVPLSAANEVPAITNAESTARGTAVITINSQTNTIDFNVSMNSFPNGSVIRAAHIHGPNAPAGVNASVLVDTGLTPATAITLADGNGTFSFTGVQPTNAAIIQQILASPQTFYFNVHSNLNTGGAIRGQLR
jgi:hypothetical protein